MDTRLSTTNIAEGNGILTTTTLSEQNYTLSRTTLSGAELHFEQNYTQNSNFKISECKHTTINEEEYNRCNLSIYVIGARNESIDPLELNSLAP